MTATSVSNKVERSIFVRAPREKVWKGLTDCKEFCRWFSCEGDSVFAPGAHVRLVSTYSEAKDCSGPFEMHIETMKAPELFTWRWHPGMKREGEDLSKEPMTLVEFRLEEADGGTRVTVVESGFDALSLARRARVLGENETGWKIQMAALERYANEIA